MPSTRYGAEAGVHRLEIGTDDVVLRRRQRSQQSDGSREQHSLGKSLIYFRVSNRQRLIRDDRYDAAQVGISKVDCCGCNCANQNIHG